MKKRIVFLLFFMFAASVCFANVIIKVRAVNPLDKNAVAPIHYFLPKEITPKDVVNHRVIFSESRSEEEIPEISEFEINYDETQGIYYVDQKIELLPKEIATLEVEVKDVWFIDENAILDLKEEVKNIEMLMEKDSSKKTDTVLDLRDEISNEINKISKKQKIFTINQVGVNKHIEVYRENIYSLDQLFLDVSMLKDLIKSVNKKEENL